jgi:sarcosine oxidase delta subunit
MHSSATICLRKNRQKINFFIYHTEAGVTRFPMVRRDDVTEKIKTFIRNSKNNMRKKLKRPCKNNEIYLSIREVKESE